MKLIDAKPLDEYLSIADSIQAEIAVAHTEWMNVLRDEDEIWRTELFGDTFTIAPVSATLSLQSFYFWLASVRMVLSGHSSAVYPLLRTSLEAACYAYKIAKEPELSNVWLERDRSSESRKRFRRQFDQAVADVAKLFDDSPDMSASIRQMYDGTIAFGGHPNPRAILDHLEIGPETEDELQSMTLTALNSATSINTVRSIVATVEHGYFSIAICANVVEKHPRSRTLQQRLDALIECVQILTKPYTE